MIGPNKFCPITSVCAYNTPRKTSFPNKLSADLRKKLADVLLLIDKVDIEIIKANAKSPSIDKVKN